MRLLLAVAVGLCIYLIVIEAPAGAVASVVVITGIAIGQHARLLAEVRQETIETIESEDPIHPEEMGTIAEAIRDRVEAERSAAERLAADLRLSIEAAAVGVLILDEAGRVLAAAGTTGDLVSPGPVQRVKNADALELVAEVRGSGEVSSDTIVMGVRGRSYQWVVSPLDGGDVGAVITDVTEANRVQAMRRSFVTDASHELKTPIASIQAGAGALEMAIGRDDDKARYFARQLEDQAQRLGRIVSDLLDLSRLESNPGHLEPMGLSSAIQVELDLARPLAEAAGVQLEEELTDLVIAGAESDVSLAVRNLLSNAIRYTPTGGTVVVRSFDRDGRAVVEVEDTGIGIPKADQELIFHRFHRVDSARSRDTGGTGLGLAIVRHIAGSHGGSVSVSSVVGQGSTFTLDFGIVSTDANSG